MDQQIFQKMYDLFLQYKENPVEGSNTSYLLQSGVEKIIKKFGEEAFEVGTASMKQGENAKKELVGELSDLLYNAMVLMVAKGITLDEIVDEQVKRFGKKKNLKIFKTEVGLEASKDGRAQW